MDSFMFTIVPFIIVGVIPFIIIFSMVISIMAASIRTKKNISNAVQNGYLQANPEIEKKDKKTQCAYCGSVMKGDLEQCPSCGARNSKNN